MLRTTSFIVIVIVIVISALRLGVDAAETTGPKSPASQPSSQPVAGKNVALDGTFVWSSGKGTEHALHAVLTPTTDDEYTVVWTFKWSGKEQVWTGTFKGDPRKGIVSGTGLNPGGSRKFTFNGKADDGIITCKHFEVTKGKETPTGNMTLKI